MKMLGIPQKINERLALKLVKKAGDTRLKTDIVSSLQKIR